MSAEKHILITGGAGYIGSLLTGALLRKGYCVTVVDELLFGGDSLAAYLPHPNFRFIKSNVWEPRAIRDAVKGEWPVPDAIVHLAGIVGFPACQAVGRQVAWRYNVEATQRVFEQAVDLGVGRVVFASTYSNYGLAADGAAVTEESPLNPQSLYAETKIAAERYLLGQKDAATAPLLFRFATLYGISPRTRFDLIVNQFVLEAWTKRELLIYQRGYSRSFVHVRDVIRGIIMGLEAEEETIRGQVFNLGSEDGNHTKDEIVSLILKRLPETQVRYKDLTFGGDMRDITVSFEKIRTQLGFKTELTVDDGVREVLHALQDGLIRNPQDTRYRNAQFIVQ
ncbi:MAG: NAD(P)-dependent oxidoreductase [Chloroflexi bacterium]|nr:MAG: NAD(P)-dependent oxidoreductase [Chloroflexota bacterium]MBL1192835.1 NAD(P)-dependent oxidoreductase [Chloroflexota bacterium]NOH10128.1 NAD(P)-dependent oxidoreductase [Chloroflexota bacterium]